MSSEPPPVPPSASSPVPPLASSPEPEPAVAKAEKQEAPPCTTPLLDIIDPYNKCDMPKRTVSSLRRNLAVNNEMVRLPLIAAASPEERDALIILKLRQCHQLFDFDDVFSDMKPKEVKRDALTEVIQAFNEQKTEFDASLFPELLKMVAVNAFRPFPAPTPDYDPEEDEPTLEPAWPHLKLVYEVFLTFIESNRFNVTPCKKFIDTKYVLNLIKLFDSEDPRERDSVKTVLHRIYGKFIGLRSYIRKEIHNVFLTFIYEPGTFNGICELLEILGSIINGFAVPLKEEHTVFLKRVLMPLHKPTTLSLYHTQLFYCVCQFLQKEPTLTKDVFDLLIHFWPRTSSKKEILFLTEIDEMLDTIATQQFNDIAIGFCKQLVKSFSSNSFQVTERALSIMQREAFLNQLINVANDTYPILVPALLRVQESHWNFTTRTLVAFTLKELAEFDKNAFREAKASDERRRKQEAKEPAEKRRTVEEEAARAGLD